MLQDLSGGCVDSPTSGYCCCLWRYVRRTFHVVGLRALGFHGRVPAAAATDARDRIQAQTGHDHVDPDGAGVMQRGRICEHVAAGNVVCGLVHFVQAN